MKIIEAIKEHTAKNIVAMILGVLSYFVLSVYSDILPNILPMLQRLPNTTIIKICIVAIILFVLSLVLSFVIYRSYKPRFKARFGILWDKDKEPFCPSCQTYLSDYTVNRNPDEYYFWCHTCKANVF